MMGVFFATTFFQKVRVLSDIGPLVQDTDTIIR